MRRKRNHSFNLFKVVCILLFVFLCLDAGLRLVVPFKQSELNVNNPSAYQNFFVPDHYGRLKPNLDETIPFNGGEYHVETNSFGLRSLKTTIEKKQDITRIAILGDSISFGWLMEEDESYPGILREMLANHSSNYEVINFSAPGFSTVQGEYLYHSFVREFQPDVLILSFGLYDSKIVPFSNDEEYLKGLRHFNLLEPKSAVPKILTRFSLIGHWFFNRSQNKFKNLMENRNITSIDQSRLRVEQETAKDALENIIHDCKTYNGRTILLDTNIETPFNRSIYDELQTNHQVQTLSVRDFLNRSNNSESRKIRYQKSLAYPGKTKWDDQSASIIFRAYAPGQSELFLRTQSFDGSFEQWDELNDSGVNGDEKTSDDVWSVQTNLEDPVDLYYKYYHTKDEDGFIGYGEPKEEGYIPLAVESNVRVLPSEEQSKGFQLMMPLVIHGTQPYQEYRMPVYPEYPSKELHQSIANRLYYVITSH